MKLPVPKEICTRMFQSNFPEAPGTKSTDIGKKLYLLNLVFTAIAPKFVTPLRLSFSHNSAASQMASAFVSKGRI